MAQPSSFRVCLVPRDFANSDELSDVAKSFRRLRLQALESDPESFSSSDFVERQKPPSFWTKRLQNPIAKTFALVAGKTDESSLEETSGMISDTWHGMLVLLGPQVVDSRTYDDKSSWKSLLGGKHPASENPRTHITEEHPYFPHMALSYHIVAVYVSENLRGKGLGRDLFEAAFAEVEKEAKAMKVVRTICTLGVDKNLTAAWKLYSAMGFVAVAEDDYILDDEREFHDTVMRRDFAADVSV